MKNSYSLLVLLLILLTGCASNGLLVRNNEHSPLKPDSISNRFYVVGGASGPGSENTLKVLESRIQEQASDSTHIILIGDNIQAKTEKAMKKDLDPIISLIRATKANSFVVPGNSEWKLDAADGLELIEDYLDNELKKENALTPNNGCPLESVEISADIQLILLDSQWYLADWDKLPEMNDKCSIKSRKKLIEEVEGEVKKNSHKLILFAMHHPMYTYGSYGGKFSVRDHIFPFRGKIPLPGLASLITQIRAQGAVTVQSRYNMRYDELMDALEPVFNEDDLRILLISGHERNLQYIEHDKIKQLISGAASETLPAALGNHGLFSYGGNGFATLEVETDGSVWLLFTAVEKDGTATDIFRRRIIEAPVPVSEEKFPENYPTHYTESVYDFEQVDKSDFFESFWGNHYRDVYGTKVKAKTAILDTLYGGLTVVRPGGGHQTKSLRLVTKDGKEYNMRALAKSAIQFLETTTFKGVDGETYFTNTIPEDLILDFYTAAHPYAALAIPALAKAAKVYYTTPELYYVPRQSSLGSYSEEYGDQLYLIVERPAEEYNRRSFGYPDDIESTDDLLEMLREDESNILDEETYIRARIFDMLLGDWDRHSDQWRWAIFENEEGKTVFEPIPRDRDQVFANFDGSFLNILRKLMGSVNQFGVYGEDIKDVRWFNKAGSRLDRALIKRSDKSTWIEQAQFIQQAIDQQTVDSAFRNLPTEVQDSTVHQIKKHLMNRKDNLVSIAERYYEVFMEFQMLTGTDKDDHFLIERIDEEHTRIRAFRIKDGEKGDLLFDRTFSNRETKEIWLYGLDDKDIFEVSGKARKPILIRIIGGQENDTYDFDEGKRVVIYDHRSKENTIVSKAGARIRRTDFYEANTYDFFKQRTTGGSFNFAMGFNPDDGARLKAGFEKTVNELIYNPYGRRTVFNVNYQFLTQGLDIRLEKSYAAVLSSLNLTGAGRYTSRNYTENFFGFGNETINPDDQLSLDYNRVNMERYEVALGFESTSYYGSYFTFKYELQGVNLVRNGNNFVSETVPDAFSDFAYVGIPEATFIYKNFDDEYFPGRGMNFSISAGLIDDLNGQDLSGFLRSSITFYNAIFKNNSLVLKSGASVEGMVGDQPAFYNSARLGADNGLRGFREQRFTGRHSLFGSADLIYNFKKIKTFFFPMQLSVYGGYDAGRVWIKNDTSEVWHQSYGGGALLHWTDAIHGRFSSFRSKEGVRIEFGFGLSF